MGNLKPRQAARTKKKGRRKARPIQTGITMDLEQQAREDTYRQWIEFKYEMLIDYSNYQEWDNPAKWVLSLLEFTEELWPKETKLLNGPKKEWYKGFYKGVKCMDCSTDREIDKHIEEYGI